MKSSFHLSLQYYRSIIHFGKELVLDSEVVIHNLWFLLFVPSPQIWNPGSAQET